MKNEMYNAVEVIRMRHNLEWFERFNDEEVEEFFEILAEDICEEVEDTKAMKEAQDFIANYR